MARPERPAARSLRRRAGVRRTRKTIRIFCEGGRTEPDYLEGLKKHARGTAAIRIAPSAGAPPLMLVRAAVKARQKAIAEESEIDEIWCLFDVEWPGNHPNLREAVELARKEGVLLAISNPCFELWLVLHFTGHGGWLTTDEAQRLRSDLDHSRGRGLDAGQYVPLLVDASRRAVELERRHHQEGTRFPDNNPSSGMHRLISSALGK